MNQLPIATIRARIDGALESGSDTVRVANETDLHRAIDSMQCEQPTWYMLTVYGNVVTMWNGKYDAASRKLRLVVEGGAL